MNDTRVNGSSAAQTSTQSNQRDATTASRMADSILTTNGRGAVRDTDGIKRDLDQLTARNPELAALVRPIVEQGLTPVERGQLAAANDVAAPSVAQTLTAPDNQPIHFSPNAPTVTQYFNAPANSVDRSFYNRLDRIWGDGNPATNDVKRIEAGLADLYRSGQTLESAEAATVASGGIDGRMVADLTQVGLDIVGIFEPTPFADLTNAGISITRGLYDAITTGNGWAAVAGVGDAAISVAGVVPGIGDTAKLLRLGRHADTITRAITAALENPALRGRLEPLLRGIKETLDNVSPAVMDALPQSAADSIRAMKTKLDEFFGVAATAAPRSIAHIGIDTRQLQHAFRHAGDFGIVGNANKQSLADFGAAVQRHLADPATEVLQGTYRGNPVTHYLNRETGLNVIVDNANNFLSGWKLSGPQFQHVTTSGRLGGG